MAEQAYSKKDLALEQIKTALALFRDGRDLFSVVTLAGAAEEILAPPTALSFSCNESWSCEAPRQGTARSAASDSRVA